jgi:peptidylprolyl isomerase
MRPAALFALACAAVLAGGCGGGGKSGSSTSTTSGPAAAASAPSTGTGAARQPATKPNVTVPSGKPPSKLVIKDLVVGTGATARPGDTVSVHYVGVAYATGKQFDASWDRGQPFTFPLGGGQVIPGWDQGVVGMKVTGRRELIVPPGLAYGQQGQPPAIAPNATLVFVIDLLRVQPGAGGATGGAGVPVQ